jgi:hypothetical protein
MLTLAQLAEPVVLVQVFITQLILALGYLQQVQVLAAS